MSQEEKNSSVLHSAQHNSVKEKNRVTLEGWAANASVAKQRQTAGRQCCLAGLLKTPRLHAAMQSEDNDILNC